MKKNNRIGRRHMLKTSAAALSVVMIGDRLKGMDVPVSNSIIVENQIEGTTSWILKKEEILSDKYSADNLWMGPIRSSVIEGYCDKLYVKQGEQISFHVSASKASSYAMHIFRIGYYQGKGGRLIKSIGSLK